MQPRIPPRTRVVLVVCALLAVVVVAARGGSAIPAGPGALWELGQREQPEQAGEADSLADTDSIIDTLGGVGVGLLLAGIGLLVLLGALGVLASFGFSGRGRRRAAPTPVRARAADAPAEDTAPAAALRAAVRAGAAALADRPGGPPADAVVAAWLVLEDAAAECGTHRSRAETASEFTARVLAAHRVDADALADLRARYHRARFAGQATAADVDAARAALARVEATIAAVRA